MDPRSGPHGPSHLVVDLATLAFLQVGAPVALATPKAAALAEGRQIWI
jgi:hypothetical protein